MAGSGLEGRLEVGSYRDLREPEPFITLEDLEGIPVEKFKGVRYEGKGSTNYSADYDEAKKLFLKETIGVEDPVLEGDSAMVQNAFIVTLNMIASARALKSWDMMNREKRELFVRNLNARLRENRIDTVGYRQVITQDGEKVVRMEDYLGEIGASANPTRKVSEQELTYICKAILKALSSQQS